MLLNLDPVILICVLQGYVVNILLIVTCLRSLVKKNPSQLLGKKKIAPSLILLISPFCFTLINE